MSVWGRKIATAYVNRSQKIPIRAAGRIIDGKLTPARNIPATTSDPGHEPTAPAPPRVLPCRSGHAKTSATRSARCRTGHRPPYRRLEIQFSQKRQNEKHSGNNVKGKRDFFAVQYENLCRSRACRQLSKMAEATR